MGGRKRSASRAKSGGDKVAAARLPRSPYDIEIVKRATAKRASGGTLNRTEESHLRRFQIEKDEESRWEHYRSVPQKHFITLTGRQAKILREQATRYGLPIDRPVVDLGEVLRSIFDFIALNKHRLRSEAGSEEETPALERYRVAKAIQTEIKNEQMLGKWHRREDVLEGFALIASILRRGGERIQKAFGVGPLEILNECIDDATNEVERRFGQPEEEEKPDDKQTDAA